MHRQRLQRHPGICTRVSQIHRCLAHPRHTPYDLSIFGYSLLLFSVTLLSVISRLWKSTIAVYYCQEFEPQLLKTYHKLFSAMATSKRMIQIVEERQGTRHHLIW